jgi:N-acetylmuramoyl-L-alanine amidase
MRELRRLLVFTGLSLLAAGSSLARAHEQDISIEKVTLSEIGRVTQLVVETDQPVTAPRFFFLKDPERFVLDLAGARWRAPGEAAGAGLAHRRRFANRPEGAARLVLDLASPARVARRRTEEGGRRLVFEFAGVGATVQLPPLGGRRVVIDPGHGGRDPGAIGVSGVREKDVTLAAARALDRALEARGYQVAMTREGDDFIELAERVAFARARHADLFVSLHADASPRGEAQGASVYMLSQTGEARSRALMEGQNWRMDLGEAARSGEVRDILVDLAQRETVNCSARFAETVIARLNAASIPVLHATPRNAGFFVLLAPDVPAALVEMGFLTHRADEARLAQPESQVRLAHALADAVDAYFSGSGETASISARPSAIRR